MELEDDNLLELWFWFSSKFFYIFGLGIIGDWEVDIVGEGRVSMYLYLWFYDMVIFMWEIMLWFGSEGIILYGCVGERENFIIGRRVCVFKDYGYFWLIREL